ncbi:MAG: hypothetical protein DHS20C01_30190 [marine bacterium B5-7]|nr:MAG: hypothetical protein DHS20C01_30190 [marine bacterium B5-7]
MILPFTVLILLYGFYLSPDFKQISAGVAVFLFGMLALEDGFRTFAGGTLDALLRKSTDRLWKSLTFGIVSTTLVQSSSLISLLTISFLSSGLISLAGGIGIIFGANLGTTTGAWLVAGFGLKVSLAVWAMPLLVVGVLLIFQKSQAAKGAGYVLLGIGFLFLGIEFMKQGFEAFRSSIDLSRFSIGGFKGLLIYTGIGLAATVVMQSSHAVLVLILTGLAAGQLSYENALALSIGSNVGTTITAIIGSLGSNQDGKRLAAAHFIFNITTGLVAIIFIGEFMKAVDWISTLIGLENDTTRLALFHSLFNITGLILMLPLVNTLEAFLVKRFHAPAPGVKRPKYLNESVKQFADTSVEAVRNETIRLYETAERIITQSLCLPRSELYSDRSIPEVVAQARKVIREDINEKYTLNVKSLYGAIVEFISQIGSPRNPQQMEALRLYRSAGAKIVEALKAIKHLQKNLLVHMVSRNPAVRDQYDKIRTFIANTLRAINTMKNATTEDVTILTYDEARIELARNDIVADGTLDELIRSHRITPDIAVSLMNDYVYAHDACNDLLTAAETLFVRRKSDAHQVEVGLSLGEEEIAELINRENLTGAETVTHPENEIKTP